MDTIETLETIAQAQAERRASPEDVLIEMGTFAGGTLAAATGNYVAVGGFDEIRGAIRMGAAMLKEKYRNFRDMINDEDNAKMFRDEALGIFLAQAGSIVLTGSPTSAIALIPDYAPTGFRALTYQVRDAFDYLSALGSEHEEAAKK